MNTAETYVVELDYRETLEMLPLKALEVKTIAANKRFDVDSTKEKFVVLHGEVVLSR